MNDLKHAFRILRKNPGFTAVALITLALGIGANTAIFSIVNSIVIKPLPYQDPESLVILEKTTPRGRGIVFSPLTFRDLTTRSGAFSSAAAFSDETMTLTGKGDPRRISSAVVLWNFFEVMRSVPADGRLFVESDGQLNGPRIVILGYGLWQRQFGGDPKAIGTAITLDGYSRTIVGIAPKGFSFPEGCELWRPLRYEPEDLEPSQRGANWLLSIARLKPGISLEQARNQVLAVSLRLAKEYPRTNASVRASVLPLQQQMVQNVKPALLVLLGAVGFVLLIACANVTNLLLAQATRRKSEVAIRTALGANPFRLIRQFLVESIVLTALSGILGLLIAQWTLDVLVRFGPSSLPRIQEIGIDLRALMFTFGISIFTGLLSGILPALQSSRARLDSVHGAVRGGRKLRSAFVIGEIAVALILLTGAGLLIKSFSRLIQVNPGFDAERVLTFDLTVPDSKYHKEHQISSFYQQLMERLSARADVQTAGAVFGLPLSDGPSAASYLDLIGKPAQSEEPSAGLRVATPDYFRAMGIPLRQGRFFQTHDTADSAGIVIISESAARRYWPNENPVGQMLRIQATLVDQKSQPREIVGIVGDVRYNGLDSDAAPEVYIPHSQQAVSEMMVVVRAKGDPAKLISVVQGEVRSLDPDLPIGNLQTMTDVVGASISQRRFTMLLLSAFAAMALLLAAIGIYGVLSYAVVQRTSELGVRMALGAQHRDLLRLILQDGMGITLAGSCIGVAGALAITRVLSGLLVGVKPADAATFAIVVAAFGVVSLLACYVPARRAMQLDPITALRYE